MSLTPQQEEELQDALKSAFPTHPELERMAWYKLKENLSEIAGGGPLPDVTFRLIQWARARGKTEELVAGALDARPGNPALQRFAAGLGLGPAAPAIGLGTPASGKAGILVDLSHGQFTWKVAGSVGAIFAAAQGQLAQILRPPPQESPWDLREIHDPRQLDADELKAWSGLLLGMPYHELVEDSTRYEIVKWVKGGGRLVLLGFELGGRHHETNVNELAGEFGLRFNSDIAAPAGWTSESRPYGVPIDFEGIQSAHPVMAGVSRLRLRNACTLTVEPAVEILLTLGENGLGRLKRDNVSYTSQGWLTGYPLLIDPPTKADWVPVVAEAPKGLTGQGSALAIGTWELIGQGYDCPAGFDNLRFVENLLDWLGGN